MYWKHWSRIDQRFRTFTQQKTKKSINARRQMSFSLGYWSLDPGSFF